MKDARSRQYAIAKISAPKLAPVYPRTRLFRLLDQKRKKPVVWVSGPAGSGKTTLVKSWLDSRKLPCLWYQLDEGDGDIATFFYYLGLAARKSAPRFRRTLPLLTPEYAFGIPVFTRRFFEELFSRVNPSSPPFDKGGRRGGFVVVFDNYHHIPESSPYHEIMRLGLSTIPEGVTIIISSRAEPPAVFSGLRANAQMEVIGWDTLRLTPEESRGIVRLETGRPTPAAEAVSIHEKAGGWAAGLILMAKGSGRSLERRSDGAVRTEETFDYFATELFNKAEKRVREFLLKTAALPKMTPGMAEKLTGNRNAGAILAGLNRGNYFTEKRDDGGPTYQYHPLFRHFLQSRADEVLAPAERAHCRSVAAELLERDGSVEDAAELYQAAGDSEGLVRIILRHAPSLIGHGRYRTLDQWISSALAGPGADNPWLLFWRGISYQPIDPPSARRNFERALELFEKKRDSTGELVALAGIAETFLFEWNDFTPLGPWLRRLGERLRKRLRTSGPSPSAAAEARACYSMAAALTIVRPEDTALPAWWQRALALQRVAGDVSLSLQVLSYAANYYIWLGDLASSGTIIQEISRLASAPQASPLARLTWKWHEAIMDIWAHAEPAAALKKVDAALAYADETGVHVWDHMLFALGVYGSLMTGALEGGREFIGKLERTLAPGRRHGYCHYNFLIAWERLLAGDTATAKKKAETALSLARETAFQFPAMLCSVELVHVLLDHGGPDEADRLAAQAHTLAIRSRSALLEYMALLAKARTAFSRGRDASGLRALREGLQLGREQGYMNQFWWHYPPALADLCCRALDAGVEAEYVRRLIMLHRLQPDPETAPPEAWPWPVKIHTLGRFRVEIDGRPLAFSGKVQKKPLELLKALVAFGCSDVPEERISEALWPDAEGDLARISFKTTMHRLRQLIGNEEAVQVVDGRVSLARQYCWTDVWAFEHMVESAECGMRSAELNPTKSKSGNHQLQFEKAIGLYKGHFLAGEDSPWSVSARERLRRKYLAAALMLGESREQARDYKAAIASYEQALDVDDLTEELYRRLMVCHQKLGRKAEAVKTYERCRRTLAAGLGVEPSEETEALYRSLLRK